MRKNMPYIIQFAFLLALFLVILFQSFTKRVEMKPLNGYDKEEPDSVGLCFSTYWDGSYQRYMTEHAKRNTGFREFFIRNYNQMAYSVFHTITNDNVVEGRDREFFLRMYLNESTGKTFADTYSSIEEAKADARQNVEKTVRLVETMRQHGTQFLFVFAPSKPAVYPEKMPKYYQDHRFEFPMEEYYIELFKEYDLPHIDFLNYFRSIKDRFPYPLYTRTGTHWSEAVLPYVADSILQKLESLTGYDLPGIRYLDDNLTTEYSQQDGELEGQMNMLFPLNKPALPRPVYALDDTLGKDKPKLLVVADSYFYQLRVSCFSDAFQRWDYWVYNREVQSSHPGYHGKQLKWVFDAADVLEQADIVMAVFTSPFYYNYMCGFHESAMNLYQNGVTSDEDAIDAIIHNIYDNPEWLHALELQAEERGITIEENLQRNAQYMLWKFKEDRKKQ